MLRILFTYVDLFNLHVYVFLEYIFGPVCFTLKQDSVATISSTCISAIQQFKSGQLDQRNQVPGMFQLLTGTGCGKHFQ